MAFTDKKLITARIKALYPNTNLSQQRMNEISDRLSNKLADDADETAIDEAVNNFNDYNPFAEIAKTDDKIRGLEKKKEPTNDPPNPDNPAPVPDDAPEWFKSWTKANEQTTKELADKVNGFATQQSQKSLTERFNSDERIKDVPDIMRRGFIPSSDDDYESKMTDLLSDYTKYNESYKVEKIGNDKPSGQQNSERKPKEASKEEVDSLASKMSI